MALLQSIDGHIHRRETINWLNWLILIGLGCVCLADYVSSIWEIRLEKDNYPTPWTIRIAGVPIAEIFIFACFILSLIQNYTKKNHVNIFRKMPLDWYVLIISAITIYGAAVGLITFSENDIWRVWLYDARLTINFVVVYWLVSRIPRNAEHVHLLWRFMIIYSFIFFFNNLLGWFYWVYWVGYSPLGALSMGSLILTDAGNVAFLGYICIMGALILVSGVETTKIRWLFGILGIFCFLLLLISLRRSNLLAIGIAIPLSLALLSSKKIIRRFVKFIPVFLVLAVILYFAGLDWNQYIKSFFTLLDRSYDSVEQRYIGNENVMLNMQKNNLWITGLGIGRHYYAYRQMPKDDLTGFSQDEIDQPWRHIIHVTNPFYWNLLKYGIIIGTFFTLLPIYMLIYIKRQSRKLSTDRMNQVFVVTSMVAVCAPFYNVLGPIDPKNAIITGAIIGLCSATMRYQNYHQVIRH